MGTCDTSNTGKGMVLGDVCYIEYRHKPFEEKYGYPAGSFRSVVDYEGMTMLFCNVQ